MTDLFTAMLLHLLHAGNISWRGNGPTSLFSDYFRHQHIDQYTRQRERERGERERNKVILKSNCKYKSHMGIVNSALNSIYLLEEI